MLLTILRHFLIYYMFLSTFDLNILIVIICVNIAYSISFSRFATALVSFFGLHWFISWLLWWAMEVMVVTSHHIRSVEILVFTRVMVIKIFSNSLYFILLQGAEAARARPPVGMDSTRWSATVDYFLTDTHCKWSGVNKECRKKQVVKNRGGTCSYGSASFKNVSYINVYLVC